MREHALLPLPILSRPIVFRTAVFALLASMALAQILSIRLESQTWDEGFDLAAGYSYWKTGDFRINREHPPLGKWIDALPLLWLNPDLPLNHPSWKASDEAQFGREFLYRNRIGADTLMLAGRSMTILLTLSFGLCLALWARKRFNEQTAVFALLLFAFDPNLIAHGRYVTSDPFLTCFAFLACITWGEYLLTRRRLMLFLAGITLGLAIASKFSAVFLLASNALMYVVYWISKRKGFGIGRLVFSYAVLGVLSYGVIVAAYAPEARLFFPVTSKQRAANPAFMRIRDVVDQRTTFGQVAGWAGARIGLPSNSFVRGMSMLAQHNLDGHPAYLMGQRSEHGWWYYLPVTFAVKTPTGVLLAVLLALVLGVRYWRALPEGVAIMLVPILVYMPLAMSGNISIGVRHLLPVYPLLHVLISVVLVNSPWRFRLPSIALVSALLIGESLAVAPHYLAFFNYPSGGPANGPRYLVDSNIDWGQDAKKLKKYMDSQGVSEVCICFFGNIELWYYGIGEGRLPETWNTKEREKADCLGAVSVTPLYDVYVPPGSFSWLREKQPIAKIGYSIYIYDLRKKK